jgi:hypothetical protein
VNADDLYTFDCFGLIVVPNVLTHSQCIAAWNELDRAMPPDAARPWDFKLGPLHEWGDPLCQPAQAPALAPYLTAMLGDGYRLDHSYAIIQSPFAGGMPLHGGATPYDPAQDYHWRDGRPHCGLVVVSIALADIDPRDGGLAYIPGSHKSNAPIPDAWLTAEACPLTRRLAQPAGSAVIFTEALCHGTWRWTGQGERRSLLYKFAPRHAPWYLKYPAGARLGPLGRPPGMATW